jgi:hypothetical protein
LHFGKTLDAGRPATTAQAPIAPTEQFEEIEPGSESRGPRVIRFPVDTSLGTLSIRALDQPGATWTKHGEARGPLSLGGDRAVRLTVDGRGTIDLSPLTRLNADDLDALELSGGGIDDAQLAHVAHLTGLTSLAIESTNVTEAGLGTLGGLTKLRSLNLQGTRLRPDAERILSELATLETLDVRGTGLPGSSIQKIERALPNCKVRSR